MKYILQFLISLVLLNISVSIYAEKAYIRPDDASIKATLTPMQFHVTQEKGTEPAFKNAYWNNEEPGIYVDVVTGEPLFSSLDKYESGTGWPSFTKPITPRAILLQEDKSLFTTRTEVISKNGRSHLGHVFDDGPAPDYKRYCMNSAALLFIPLNDMKAKGYGEYLLLFSNNASPSIRTK